MSDLPAGWVQRGTSLISLSSLRPCYPLPHSLLRSMHAYTTPVESRSRGGQIYYFNPETGESVWEKPTEPTGKASGQVSWWGGRAAGEERAREEKGEAPGFLFNIDCTFPHATNLKGSLLNSLAVLCCVVSCLTPLGPPLPPSLLLSLLKPGPRPPPPEKAQKLPPALLLATGGNHLHERGGHESRLW